MNRKNLLTTLIATILLGLGASSCGEGNSSAEADPATTGSYSYAGPGSTWEMSREDTTYTIEMEDGSDSLNVTASGTTLSTGHIKLTVTDASAGGSATAPSNGDIAHAVEVPGAAFLLKPMEANSETIAMIQSGSCPDSDFTANWVIGQRAGSAGSISDASKDWLGSITFDVSAGSATFPTYSALELPSTATGTGGTFGTCSNGKITWTQTCNSTSTDNEIYFTESGLMIVATCKGVADQSHIIAIPQQAISDVSNIYGDYAGFAFLESDDDTKAFSATIAADSGNNSKITFSVLSGNDLDTVDSTYTVTFDHRTSGSGGNLDSPTSGFFRGEFSTCNAAASGTDEDCDIVCTVAQDMGDNDKNMLYCIAQDPGNEEKRVTLLLVEK